ncbi:MAG: response regulator transcription factor [Balneolaceae bacterium]|nr:response regulator transcription factor [Balneolaceae bacterium]
MDTIKILIAESTDIYRLGIETALAVHSDFSIIKSVDTGKKLIQAFKAHPNSICLLSSNIPDLNIHEIMDKMKEINQGVLAIVLTHSTDLFHLNQSLKAGVMGYLTKNAPASELIKIVREVHSGEQAFSESVSQIMISQYTDHTKRSALAGNKKSVTKREKEILKLIVDGYTSAEIAKMLYISTRTVETHRSNLMNKLGIKNTAALVRYAMREAGLR